MQRSNCGNVHPILKMMPNILKAFINVKKSDFTRFMKMFCTARVLLTPFPDSGIHPKQLKNLNLSLSPYLRICPFTCPVLDPRAMYTVPFLIKDAAFYLFGFPCAHTTQVNVTLFPYSSQRKTIGPPICTREENYMC